MRFGARQASSNPLSDPRSLKFGNRTQDVHLELAGRRGRVDAFGE
jgi:hypothetical protein